MKRFFFFIFSMIFSFYLQAQAGWIEDKQAQEIMLKLAKKFASVTGISADLMMITENKTNNTKEEKKIYALISGARYRILFGNQSIYCNGKLLWHYNKDTDEVTISTADSTETQQINLPKIISGWDKNYRPKLIREEEQKGEILQILDLTPKKRQEYHKIRLIINKNKQKIQRIQFHSYDGETISYVFLSFKTNPAINLSDFTFDSSAHPSAEVIDLR